MRAVKAPGRSLTLSSIFSLLQRYFSWFLSKSTRATFFIPAFVLIGLLLAFPVIQTAYLGFVFKPIGSATLGENPEDAFLGMTEDTGVRFTDPDANFDMGDAPGGRLTIDNTSFLWIRFNISVIPSDATLESVTLYLFSASHEATGELKQLRLAGAANTTAGNNWGERSATWNTFDGSSPWTGGGDGGTEDRTAAFRLRAIQPSEGDGYLAFELAPNGLLYVQKRLGGSVSFQVYGTNIGHERRFVVSEGPEGERPFLEVVFEEARDAVGFQNYEEILTSRDTINLETAPFPPLGTLLHNLIWIAIHLPVTLFGGLFLAILVRDMRGASVVKGIVFLGMVTPLIIGGMILRFLFTQDAGLVPAFFAAIGVSEVEIGGRVICLSCTWTLQPETLLPALIMGSVWLWTGFSLIVYSAGLTTIPKDYFEAARMDGASPFRIFRRITFPLLKPITLVVITMTLLYELKIFDIVIAATNEAGGVAGAGDVLALQMYRLGFVNVPFEPNLAAAVATILTFLTLFATIWTLRYLAGTGPVRPILRPAMGRVWKRITGMWRK